MDAIAYFATTPDGETLGKLAAQLTQVRMVPSPIWMAPLEPLRCVALAPSLAEPMVVVVRYFAAVGIIGGLLAATFLIRRSFLARLVAFLVLPPTLFLTLSALSLFFFWLDFLFPRGAHFIVPSTAPFVLANFHSHSRFSAGTMSPEDLVVWHFARGYRVLSVTDTNRIDGSLRAKKWVEQNGLPMTIVTGEEFRGPSHLILLGIKESLSPSKLTVAQVIATTRRQGGIAIAAHPWHGAFGLEELVRWGAVAAEWLPTAERDGRTLTDHLRRLSLAAVGALDNRYPRPPALATVLPADATTEEKVLKTITQGRCAVLYLPDRLVPLNVGAGEKLLRAFLILWKEGGSTGWLGIAFWCAVGGWYLWKRRKKIFAVPTYDPHRPRAVSHPLRIVALVACCSVIATVMTVWTFSRDLADLPRPPVGLAVLTGLITSALSWWGCLSLRSG
ncbi:MAG: hypothetical protein NZ959_06250 [Armatimonadetes bacterium]|nr:hypothetical protein [Armatimonadota bacterium]MDW8121645.1 hypothetical protein [Armatimonadota bacterium]